MSSGTKVSAVFFLGGVTYLTDGIYNAERFSQILLLFILNYHNFYICWYISICNIDLLIFISGIMLYSSKEAFNKNYTEEHFCVFDVLFKLIEN